LRRLMKGADATKSATRSYTSPWDRTLKARISDLEKEQDFRTQMLDIMKETLEQRPQSAV
ncbi:hypothetical protein, partial [Sulfitobacter sp. 1A15299]|uniref:hypothetical protein n=1 Tax=Sulfitobacter sp. 1A15299 TaxID=3368598 RepID=UPI003746F4D2